MLHTVRGKCSNSNAHVSSKLKHSDKAILPHDYVFVKQMARNKISSVSATRRLLSAVEPSSSSSHTSARTVNQAMETRSEK